MNSSCLPFVMFLGLRPHFTIAFVLASACTMSDLDPNAEVALTGATYDDLGQALAGQRVALVKEPDIGEVLSGIILFPVTVLACLGDTPPTICQAALIDRTDAAGAFSFSMLGSDTHGSIGNASFFTAATTLPALEDQSEGPSTYQRFQIQSEQLTLPSMKLWTAPLNIENNSDSIRVSVANTANFELRFETGEAWGAPIWEETHYDGNALDSRLFEDSEMRVVAIQRSEAYVEGSTVESVARSATYALRGNAGAPPSRGAGCSVSDREGNLLAMSPCPMTDGNLALGYRRADDGCMNDDEVDCSDSLADREAVIDLGAVADAEFLVLRLGYYETQVQYSVDGQSWSSVGVRQSGDIRIDLPPGTSLRYLRLTTMGSVGSLVGLSEVSIW